MKESLVGHNATRLEKLAAERIAAFWLETEYLRLWLGEHPQAEGTKVSELFKKRFEEASRALRAGHQVAGRDQEVLPKTIKVTVLQKAVNVPTAVQSQGMPSTKDVSSANGKRVDTHNGTKKASRRAGPVRQRPQ